MRYAVAESGAYLAYVSIYDASKVQNLPIETIYSTTSNEITKQKNMKKLIAKFNNVGNKNDKDMPLTMRNYVLMIVGAVVIVLGFVLMAGGTVATPEEFSYDIFSWRRITLAPILVVAGFAFEIYAILKRF